MTQLFRNYIAGEWIEGPSAKPNRNPSDLSDVIGDFAQADAAQTRTAVAAAKQAFPAWSLGSIQQRFDILDKTGTEILSRKDELGRCCRARRARRFPRAWASGPRRQHLQVLRGRGAAAGRRADTVRAPGRRRRGDA